MHTPFPAQSCLVLCVSLMATQSEQAAEGAPARPGAPYTRAEDGARETGQRRQLGAKSLVFSAPVCTIMMVMNNSISAQNTVQPRKVQIEHSLPRDLSSCVLDAGIDDLGSRWTSGGLDKFTCGIVLRVCLKWMHCCKHGSKYCTRIQQSSIVRFYVWGDRICVARFEEFVARS